MLEHIIICRPCPLRPKFPHCSACEYKGEFDEAFTKIKYNIEKSLFRETPLFYRLHPDFTHPSRWREERARVSKTIRIPLFYG